MLIFYPKLISHHDGMTVVCIPGLQGLLDDYLVDLASGVPMNIYSHWSYHIGYPEGTYSLLLTMSFPDEREVSIVFTPIAWQHIGKLYQETKAIGLLGDESCFTDEGLVTTRETEMGLMPTVLRVPLMDSGLRDLIPHLEQLLPTSDTNGNLTYLLTELGARGGKPEAAEKVEG